MIRTTRPEAGNKYYITKSSGGYSTCIKGKPTDELCNVLSNCVGYACGAANEELELGYEKYHLNCNAENFIERAIASGLSVYKTPQVGDIICWEGKGSLAGHVGIVIEIIDNNCIRVAQSAYGSSKPFYITKNYNTNGRWGLSANYPFRGFIRILPEPPKPEPTPTPIEEFKIGDKVCVKGYATAASDGTGSRTANYGGNPTDKTDIRYITLINKEAKRPYHISVGKEIHNGDRGWVTKEQLTKVE
jgi:hypothetical protein